MSSIAALLSQPQPDDMSNSKRVLKHSLIEFLATAIFIYFGTLSAVSTGFKLNGEGPDVARVFPIAFSFGVSITCLVYAIGHITGGHMNPGVSLLMFFKLQISFKKMLCYWLAQFVASVVASALVWASVSGLTHGPPFQLGATVLGDVITFGNGFLIELFGSFFFYFVIAQTALDNQGIAKTSIPPLPIGLSLVVVHICLIPFTGCGVNPARTFGPAVVTCMGGQCSNAVGPFFWAYFVAPFLASFLVAEATYLTAWVVEDEEEYGAIEAVEAPVERDDPVNLSIDFEEKAEAVEMSTTPPVLSPTRVSEADIEVDPELCTLKEAVGSPTRVSEADETPDHELDKLNEAV